MKTSLPEDSFMLLSYINLKLRDEYDTLKELCKSLDIEENELCKKLRDAGFEYSVENNRFW